MSVELAARSGSRTRAAWWAAVVTLAVSLAVLLRSGVAVDAASGGVLRALALAFPAALLLGATASHYAASGMALQAAAGVRLPWRERYLSQLAAAAANRVAPGGVGAAALNARYLTRRGSTASCAVAAIGAMQVLGVIADLAVLAALFAVGSVFGITPTGGWSRLGHEVELPVQLVEHHPWVASSLWFVAGVLAVRRAIALRTPRTDGRNGGVASVVDAIRGLRTRPRDVATLMGASAWTTLVLGLAFAASVAVVTGPGAWRDLLPLVIGYMVGSAVGNAAPVPSGIGTTDTALVGVVVASGAVMHQAVIAVVIFRVVSFWTPAAVGLIAGATLRRRGAY